MTIDFIDAVNAYKKVANQGGSGLSSAFDEISALSSQANFSELLKNSLVSDTSLNANNADLVSMANSVLRNAKKALRKSEVSMSKSLLNEESLTDLVTSVSEAELKLQAVISVRDRVIEAYNSIMGMPI